MLKKESYLNPKLSQQQRPISSASTLREKFSYNSVVKGKLNRLDGNDHSIEYDDIDETYSTYKGKLDPVERLSQPDTSSKTKSVRERKSLDVRGLDQSDPAILELQARMTSKAPIAFRNRNVYSIEDAQDNPHEIDRWIENVAKLQAMKPDSQVQFRHPYPCMDDLRRQEWPMSFQNYLKEIGTKSKDKKIPDPALDLTIMEYARVLCCLLDIPVYDDNMIHSIHMMFQLYLEYESQSEGEGLFRSEDEFCTKE